MKINNWFQYPKDGYITTNITHQLGYYKRNPKRRKFYKTKNERIGQLKNRGHGKIPLCPVRFKDGVNRKKEDERIKRIVKRLQKHPCVN